MENNQAKPLDVEPGGERKVTGFTTVTDVNPVVGTPPNHAGGPEAVIATIRHAVAEMGAVRSIKILSRVNQKGGFDCPGCAWPDPDGQRSRVAEYCENGAKAVSEEATRRQVTPAFFRKFSLNELSEQSDYWLGKQGRITHPMFLRHGADHYVPISWADAFEMIGRKLNDLASPNEAVFYTSGRTSNEAAFLFQMFARCYGTNNLPDCSNLCHESSGRGLKEVIGVGKGTVTLADFEQAEVIVVVGQNPGTNHPRMLATLEEAKLNGARIIHVNPLPEVGLQRFRHPKKREGWIGNGTRIADEFLQVRINGDVALFKGLMKALLEGDRERPGSIIDHSFIATYTDGFEAFEEDLDITSWAEIEEASGISREQMNGTLTLLAPAQRVIICWAMGLTQHRNAVANVQSMVNMLLMKGAIGKPGAGACPVRGHSNVQGDRTMGINTRPSDTWLNRFSQEIGFEAPRDPGLDVVQAIEAMKAGNVRVFFGLGGNFLSASPDTAYTARALQSCDLTIHVSTKLHRGHLATGTQALILPCLGRTERDEQSGGAQFVTVENSMGVVHTSKGTLTPASEHLLSEPAIVAEVAASTLCERSPVDWHALVADYDQIRELIARVVPGCDGYNKRVRKDGGFYLPNAAREGQFDTKTGLARFTVHPIPSHDLEDGQFLMMTIRSHDQFNTTIYGLDDRYRGIRGGRRVAFMHLSDIEAAGFAAGDVVDLISEYEDIERRAPHFTLVAYDIPRGCMATYFPEANVLVPIHETAYKSNTPVYKSVVVSLRGPTDVSTSNATV